MRVKDIPGFEGLYVVTDQGDVIRLYRSWRDARGRLTMRESRTLVCAPGDRGYRQVRLFAPGIPMRLTYVHRLVAAAFCEPFTGEVVNHINGIPGDDRAENLEWCDTQSNLLHGRLRKKHVRLTARQIMDVKRLSAEDVPLKTICSRYDIDRATAQRIIWGAKRKPA